MMPNDLPAFSRALIRDELAANIRAARARKGLRQDDVAVMMRDLGFPEWHRQTVASVEHRRRRVGAEDIFALAIVLGTSTDALMSMPRIQPSPPVRTV